MAGDRKDYPNDYLQRRRNEHNWGPLVEDNLALSKDSLIPRQLGPFLVSPLYVRQYSDDDLEKTLWEYVGSTGVLDQILTHVSEPLARFRSTRGLGSERRRALRLPVKTAVETEGVRPLNLTDREA